MKLIEIKCKNCNSPLRIEEGKAEVTCDYCHSNFYIDDEIRKNAIEVKETINIAKKELKEERNNGLKIGCLVSFIIAFILILISLFGTSSDNNKEEIEIFDYLILSFSGNNGEGTATASINDNDKGIIYDEFNCEFKNNNLSNNDKIKVTCTSNKYKLLTQEKIFNVTGLNEYLHDVSELSEDNLNEIHKISEIEVDKIISSFPLNISTSNKKYIKTFLLSDLNNNNTLFDVYEVNITLVTGVSGTVYEAIKYNNIIVYDNNINYESLGDLSGYGKIGPFSVKGYNSLEETNNKIKNLQESNMKISER